MTDLARLFQEDPLKLTREDITEIIKAYREARLLFAAGDTKAGSTKKITGEKPKIESIEGLDL